MLKSLIIVASLLFIASCSLQQAPANTEPMHFYQAETHKPYDEVLNELQVAIAEHNFRITGHSRIGKVIRERGTDKFPEYDTLQFCNVSHAKTLLEISPHAVIYMPCNVVTYQFEGITIIKTHLLPEHSGSPVFNAFAVKMNQTLKQIVDFAAEQ